MGFDSSANLLFTIAGDSSDVEGTMSRFRQLMSKDLGDISSEFSAWSDKIFGDLSTAEGAMTAFGAATAAAFVVAIAAAAKLAEELYELAQREAEFAEAVQQGVEETGLSAERISQLGFAAKLANVSQEELNGGMAKFARAVEAAQDPTTKQARAFHDLGIDQADVTAGLNDLWPLILKTADAFRSHADGVGKTTDAQALFARSGAKFIQFLNEGSDGLKTMADQSDRLGLTLSGQALEAAQKFRTEQMMLKATFEGVALAIGEKVIPQITELFLHFEAWIRSVANVGQAMEKGGWHWYDNFIPGGSTFWAKMRSWETDYRTELDKVTQEAQERVKALMSPDEGTPKLSGPGGGGGKDKQDKQVQQSAEVWTRFSDILQQVQGSLAGATSAEEKITGETGKLTYQVQKAYEQFYKLGSEGKLSAQTVATETQAYWQANLAITQLGNERLVELARKTNAAQVSAAEDLKRQIESKQQDSYQHQVALWDADVQKLSARYAKEGALTIQNWALLEQLEQAGYAKLEAEQSQAFAKKLASLNTDLAQITNRHLTAEQQIAATYKADVANFSAAEQAKTLAATVGEAQRHMIELKYEQGRIAALQRYQQALTELHNSQGWRGVLGDQFRAALQSDEALMQQWAASTNQSLLLVKVAVADVKQMLLDAFKQFANAEGQAIANSIEYSQAVGEAMRAAAAATLESLAAQSLGSAIFATAQGFLDLAMLNFAGAEEAFTAAALFGAVGGVAAAAGRAIAPKQASSAGGGGSSTAAAAGAPSTSGAAPSSSGSSASSGPNVTIYITTGHVIGPSGIDELASMLSDAVKGRDVRLIATQVKQATRAVR